LKHHPKNRDKGNNKMAMLQISFKRLAIDKATKTIMVILVTASILTVFALAGSRALINQLRYQKRVIDAKTAALRQLEDNTQAVNSLQSAYQVFEGEAESIVGTDDKNSRIILDALPSKYDFPALTTSLEKLLTGYKIDNIAGNDDEVAQALTPSSQVVEIPFQLGATANYGLIQELIKSFNRSIRPLHILSLELSGNDDELQINVQAKTYYQAAKSLEIGTKDIE
jgi:hypothetical protein